MRLNSIWKQTFVSNLVRTFENLRIISAMVWHRKLRVIRSFFFFLDLEILLRHIVRLLHRLICKTWEDLVFSHNNRVLLALFANLEELNFSPQAFNRGSLLMDDLLYLNNSLLKSDFDENKLVRRWLFKQLEDFIHSFKISLLTPKNGFLKYRSRVHLAILLRLLLLHHAIIGFCFHYLVAICNSIHIDLWERR